MTPEDFSALVEWLYALPFAPAGPADDMRLNRRNVRGMASGRTAVPPTVAAYLEGRAALRLTLNGWRGEMPAVSAECRARILDRLDEARRHAEKP